MVILAGELLRESKTFVEEGVHPRAIIHAYRQVLAQPWWYTECGPDKDMTCALLGCMQ